MAEVERPVPDHITDPDQVPGVEPQKLPWLKIIDHSNLLYWWPVWLLGYIMALITYLEGNMETIGGVQMYIHPSKNLGVIYTVVFMLVILFTNVTLRGWISVLTVVSIMFFTVLFAYLGWWDEILSWIPYLSIHMNMGFYIFFSTFLLIIWCLAFFFFDRFEFWRVRPGLLTQEFFVGGAERSFDTRSIYFEQLPQDLFRNWILGMGSGDIRIIIGGPGATEVMLHNVLFVNSKVRAAQKLIAVKPDEMYALRHD